MSRDIVQDHTWDPSLAETVPVIWAFVQAAAAVIITALPSLTLRLSIWYKRNRYRMRATTPEPPIAAPEILQSDSDKVETDETTLAASSLITRNSDPISSKTSHSSKAEKILGMSQRLKRSKTPDEYSEECHRMDSISGITVTRTVNVTTAIDPEEGFRLLYRKYCGQA